MALFLSAGVAFGQTPARQASAPCSQNCPQLPAPSSGTAAENPRDETPGAPPPSQTENRLKTFPQAFVHDEIGMWTSPARIRLNDATWLVPIGGFAAALFATDTDVSRHLSNDPNTLRRYRHISDYGVYSMAAGAGGMYFFGLVNHNDHQRETGFLSGEAAVDALAALQVIKFATGRERPYQNNASGQFFKSGSSFPSEHSAVAWSIASMVSHEYPSPFMRFFSYGLATLVSASRITAKEHFPSDVLIGSALGYLTGEWVYHEHHNPDLPGAPWQIPAIHTDRPMHWRAKDMGSPYVPLDSWVYPELDRLAALGYISSAISDMKPWTRMECARQTSEAGDRISEGDIQSNEAASLYEDLLREFGSELTLLGGGDNTQVRLDRTYTRSTEIVGKPLTDGYHFGQTVVDDFGRPEQQGFNNVSGLAGWGTIGPFAAYINAEYQHSPSAPALPLTAREAISNEDFVQPGLPVTPSVPPDTPIAAISRARLLDSYVAMNLSDWQFSYGKQSLSWGPSHSGGLMFSDNAEPLTMFRINRVTPFTLPSFLSVFGPMRLEFFIGQYSGYEFMYTPMGLVGQYGASLNPQPIVHGERISFKPWENFEFSLSRTTDYGGPGYPLTLRNFARSLFSTSAVVPGAPDKAGAHRSGLDFSYRIHNAITFYGDGMTEHDTISPIVSPDTAAWVGGVYIPRLLKLAKMDFRAEGMETDPPIGGNEAHGFFYYDPTWTSGFTNKGQLMGNWVGREGQGAQAWISYWFTPRNRLQFEYRHLKVSHEAIPNGGTMADAGVRAGFWTKSGLSVSAAVQYEAWTYPVISPTRQSNITSSVQLSFWPKGWSRTTAGSTDGTKY